MTPTVQYLFTALASLLNNTFDPIAQFASRNEHDDHGPLFPQDIILSERADNDPGTQVRHMLQIQDRPAMSKEVAADQIAFENTGEVNDLLHSVDCEQRCRWPYYEWLNDAAAPGFARFWITWKDTPDNCLGMGAEVPKQLPELLRRALLMQNLFNPNAQVLPMVVVPRRRFQLLVADNGNFACTHAVLLIIFLLAGKFILDPTAEQYGFPHKHRFLPWSVYKDLYVVDATKFRGAAVWSTRFDAYMRSLQEGENFAFWDSVKDGLDVQVAAWLKDCGLRVAVDDAELWKIKSEQLEEMVVQSLESLQAGAAS
ncbi:hypothetical protein N0V91_009598 [Didymella pomorum]|uniref:Uncharacterized protein n=1 Tax=Didymella pomorum TaxID=749634 RepID=A0A9W8Z6R2_9PLEO|nr:hypothetical protein N0V91_009598 [Didymella pomorum]